MIQLGAPEPVFCERDGEQMDLIPFSKPGYFRVGKFGKAGGLPPEPSND